MSSIASSLWAWGNTVASVGNLVSLWASGVEPVVSLKVASVALNLGESALNSWWSLAAVDTLLESLWTGLEARSILRVVALWAVRVAVDRGKLHVSWANRCSLWHASVNKGSPAASRLWDLVLSSLLPFLIGIITLLGVWLSLLCVLHTLLSCTHPATLLLESTLWSHHATESASLSESLMSSAVLLALWV